MSEYWIIDSGNCLIASKEMPSAILNSWKVFKVREISQFGTEDKELTALRAVAEAAGKLPDSCSFYCSSHNHVSDCDCGYVVLAEKLKAWRELKK